MSVLALIQRRTGCTGNAHSRTIQRKREVKRKGSCSLSSVYDEDSDNDVDANDANALEPDECTTTHGGSTSPNGMACTPQLGGLCRPDREFFNQFGLTYDPSHEEPVSMPTLHFQDKNVKDMIIELGRTGRYCVLLTADEIRRLRNQEAGHNVLRPKVPLVVQKDLAATVAFYQAAMMHEALETDQTRELQFGIGNYDVQMMIVDHDTLSFRCDVTPFDGGPNNVANKWDNDDKIKNEGDQLDSNMACSARLPGLHDHKDDSLLEMPSGAWLMDTGCACDLISTTMSEG